MPEVVTFSPYVDVDDKELHWKSDRVVDGDGIISGDNYIYGNVACTIVCEVGCEILCETNDQSLLLKAHLAGCVAQLAECVSHEHEVPGSTPGTAILLIFQESSAHLRLV